METNITVSGSIVKELSEKIPNNIIALNELIKNAYDAGSKKVDIKISTEEKKMIIRDYGVGMDEEDIKKLFHISSSSKRYGKTIKVNNLERITQGSKGLGFLSVFKFGDFVKWTTYKEKSLSFSARYSEIIRLSDISDYKIPIVYLKEEMVGTEIEIELTEYNLNTLSNYFTKEKNRKKILNSFINITKKDMDKQKDDVDKKIDDVDKKIDKEIRHDADFIIKLNIDGQNYETDLNIPLEKESKEQQLTRVKYDSEVGMIKYYSDLYGGILLYSEELDFTNSDFSVNIDLQTYVLKSHGKKKINKLFFHPVSEELTPLVYVNNNLFNNFELFDTNLMSAKKYGSILSQIIGYVSIVSDSESIDFNSDRTKFVQNDLTDRIAEFLEELNIKVQTTGSILKNEMKPKAVFLKTSSIEEEKIVDDFDFLSLVKDDFKLKSNVKYTLKNDLIEYELLGVKRSVKIIKKEKEIVTERAEYFSELVPNSYNELKDFDTLIYNGKKVDSFDTTKIGDWKFVKETDNQIITKEINITESRQPKIEQRIRTVEHHKVYGYDDLFIFENSFYQEDIGIIPDIKTGEVSSIHNDRDKGELTFGKDGTFTFPVSIVDKVTKKTYEMDATFKVISKDNEIVKIDRQSNFIKIPISKGKKLPATILVFISELNELSTKEEFTYSFVSSYRTLVELCVIDILNIKNIEKDTTLAANYSKVLSLLPSFIEDVQDQGNKQILNNILRAIQPPVEKQAYISFLNLCTHGSNTMISKQEVVHKTKELTLLLEYLNHLNS